MKKILLPTFLLLFSIFLNAQTITEIQGTGDVSPYDGQSVTTTGIVTAVAPQGYFIQDGTDVRSGIYVYEQDNSPALGDEITLTGTVAEFFELTEIVDLTSFTINSSNNTLPDPISVSTGDASSEDYEGMLVTVQNATCTNTDIGFGEWQINDGSGALAVDDLMYLFSSDLNIDYGVTGILTYTFNNYKIEPRSMDDVEIQIPLYFTVHPKESNISTSSLTVNWETNIPANTKLSYGLTDALELGTLENLTSSTIHEVVLENLSPATIYYVKPFSEDGVEVTPSETLVMATASNSSGKMNVYFNHSVDHAVATDELAIYTPNIVDTIISYIDLAQQSLDITMYEAENQEIVDAINAAYDRGVTVRVISDFDDMTSNETFDNLNSNISYLEGNTNGIMHDKFFIIDREDVDNSWVLTGSMNHTVNNLGWDYNNIITIQDQSLARAYTLEFQEMWGGDDAQFNLANSKFGNEKSDNTPHHFSINNIPVELYFSPTDGTAQRITKAIDAAENELAFAVLVFTENALGTAVKNAYDRGVATQGIIDYVEFSGSEYNYLLDNNIDVQDYQNDDGSQWPDGPTLHHKYAIIDYAQGSATPLLITGSHNWSASANSIHDENTLLIYDHTLANIYYQEFSARFQGFTDAANNLKIDPLKISPNPFVEQLNFEVPENGNLVVSDLAGRIIFQQKINVGSNHLDTENWMSGIYFVKFVGENTQRIGKVIKQ
ncbi:MAG: phospholipase D-like domain-containing protein [Saprospiraceae bacterium]